jgi:membrane protein implicated in regulation of membrane protease activity
MFNLNQRQTSPNPFHNIRGQATVSKPIYPHRLGRVYCRGTWWSAKCHEDITVPTNEIVEVVGIENITLIVKPVSWKAASGKQSGVYSEVN